MIWLLGQLLEFLSLFIVPITSLNITIVTYGISSASITFNAMGYVAPAVNVGIQEVQDQYGFNISHVVLPISNPKILTCDEEVMNTYLVSSLYYSRVDNTGLFAIISSVCGETALALSRLSREWNTLVITSGAMHAELRKRHFHPTVVSMTTFSYEIYRQAFMSIFQKYSWSTIALIYDTSDFTPFFTSFMREMQSYIVGLTTNFRLLTFAVNSVILLGFHATHIRTFMLVATNLGMTDYNYVYFVFENFPSFRRYGNLTMPLNDGFDQMVLVGYNQMFQLSTCSRDNNPRMVEILQQIKESGIRDYNVTFLQNEQPTEVAVATYFSVKTFGQVLNETYHSNESVYSAVALANRFRNRQFTFNSGSVYLDEMVERLPDYCFKRLSPETNLFEDVLHYNPSAQALLLVGNSYIKWNTQTGSAPPNMPVCGYSGTLGPCRSGTLLYSASIAGVLLVICGIMVVLLLLFRRENVLRNEWWRIDETELHKIYPTKSFLENRRHQSLLTVDPEILSKDVFVFQGIPTHIMKISTRETYSPNRAARAALAEIRMVTHQNIVRIFGLCTGPGMIAIVQEFCEKGDLFTALEKLSLDWNDRVSLLSDMIEGLCVVHTSSFKRHGYISPESLFVNKRLTLQIGNVGVFEIIRDVELITGTDTEKVACEAHSRWTAPEHKNFLPHLQNVSQIARHVGPEADMYALGAIIEFLKEDCQGSPDTEKDVLSLLAEACLADNPADRPNVFNIRQRFRRDFSKARGIPENLMNRMEIYAQKLEVTVAERTKALLDERRVCEELLAEMMPRAIIRDLLTGSKAKAEKFDCVTVLFSYIMGFLDLVLQCRDSPDLVVTFLNKVFIGFDRLLVNRDIYKVETIADTYMLVSGLPNPNGDKHASEICEVALELLNAFGLLCESQETNLHISAGINSGSVAAGIVGNKRPRYCLFGDTVNIASRLATQGWPSKIQISQTTSSLIEGHTDLKFTYRGLIYLKGKGEESTYWLTLKSHREKFQLDI